jgi:hypothetical protein
MAKAKTTNSETPAESTGPKGKLGAMLALLLRPDGAILQAMQDATGWQAHSVRDAMSGAIKKKLGFPAPRCWRCGRRRRSHLVQWDIHPGRTLPRVFAECRFPVPFPVSRETPPHRFGRRRAPQSAPIRARFRGRDGR